MILDAPQVETRPRSATELLTRHFLRRFLDNDLISSNTDRHETLTVGATMLISFGLFVSVLLASKYIMNPFPTPVHMALGGMQDRFLFVGTSMLVMALVAVAQWDALSLDSRDTAILGVLPVTLRTIVVAKLASLVVFSTAFVLVLNVGPAVLYPLFFASQLPLSLANIVTMCLAHSIVTLAAGALGVASIVAFREGMRLVLGARVFRRVSTLLQATLVVTGITTLLLLPGFARAVRASLDRQSPVPDLLPPVWFIGLHEVIVGDSVGRLPVRRVPEQIMARERRAVATYRSNRPVFRANAAAAVGACGAMSLLALMMFAWNNRRLPADMPFRVARRPAWRRAAASAVERSIAPTPPARAGYFFTLQVLPRSAPHRVAMATAAAAGLASLTVALGGIELHSVAGGTVRLGAWAAQTLVVTALLAGFRHAVRVPAELKASGSFLLAWPGEERAYLGGVKRAALVAVALPAIALLFPVHVLVFGAGVAVLHALCGLALAHTQLEALCVGMRQPPFVRAYFPAGSLKRAAPIYFAGIVIGCYGFAGIERRALQTSSGTALLLAALALTALFLRWRDGQGRQIAIDIELEDVPEGTVQRLDIGG